MHSGLDEQRRDDDRLVIEQLQEELATQTQGTTNSYSVCCSVCCSVVQIVWLWSSCKRNWQRRRQVPHIGVVCVAVYVAVCAW